MKTFEAFERSEPGVSGGLPPRKVERSEVTQWGLGGISPGKAGFFHPIERSQRNEPSIPLSKAREMNCKRILQQS
jgi:hypothetical protein